MEASSRLDLIRIAWRTQILGFVNDDIERLGALESEIVFELLSINSLS